MNQFWTRAQKFPPIICRLLARRRWGPPLSAVEIAMRSGGSLSPAQLDYLSEQLTWDTVPLGQMRAFLRGCGIDFFDRATMDRISQYLAGKRDRQGHRRPPQFTYLRRSPLWDSYYRPLIQRWLNSQITNRKAEIRDHKS